MECTSVPGMRYFKIMNSIKPQLTERTIVRILVRHGLTHGRTGFYP